MAGLVIDLADGALRNGAKYIRLADISQLEGVKRITREPYIALPITLPNLLRHHPSFK